MSTTETPVAGGGAGKGLADGVSDAPGADKNANIHGRSAAGESGGGSYPNPQSGKEPSNSGFMGHGGQTDIAYHGGGQGGEEGGSAPNAVTGADSSDATEDSGSAWAAPTHAPHRVMAGGQTFDVVETSGVAEAELSGKVGTDAAYEAEQESPGSG